MSFSKRNGRRRSRISSKSYPLEASPFFRLERKRDLASLLYLSLGKLDRLLSDRGRLYSCREEIVGAKVRQLTIPLKAMRRCHDRIFHLLRRIELPEYIRCPRAKSTAWGNAFVHTSGRSLTTFDIKGFYPSTSEEHVFRFFRYRLEMSEDCARRMALLCTHQGFLPLGSPMSPHLASLVHLDLFDDANALANGCGNKLTVWVDDVAFSGARPRRDIFHAIKRKATSKGLTVHKIQRGGGRRGVELTGAYVRNGAVGPANSSHLRMKELSTQLEAEDDPSIRYHLLNRLSAMARHQRMIVRQNGVRTEQLDARIAYYRRMMRGLDKQLSVTPATQEMAGASAANDDAPFD